MSAPCTSFLDSEHEGFPVLAAEKGRDNEDFAGDIDVTGTLFATLLTDIPNFDNTDIFSDMSSNSDTESDEIFDYLSNPHENAFEFDKSQKACEDAADSESVKDNSVMTTRSCRKKAVDNEIGEVNASKSAYSRPPLMCSNMVNMKSPRVDIERMDSALSEANSRREKCMNRNAVVARENREKKKQYMKQLENNLERVNLENHDLKMKYSAKSKHCDSLEKEVKYLRSVLANQSSLSELLKNIHATRNVSFTSSLSFSANTDTSSGTSSPKRSLDENDNYEHTSKGVYVRATGSHKKARKEAEESKSDRFNSPLTPCPSPDEFDGAGGVCLHVSNKKVSLELCSLCAENASDAWNKTAKIDPHKAVKPKRVRQRTE